MQKIRFAPLAILSLSIGLMTACDSTSANGKAPTVSSPVYISGVQTGPTDVTNTLDNVTVYHLTGTVTDVKSWSWTVLSGSTVVETLVEPSPAGDGDTKLGNTYTMVTFTPKASWGPTGTYTLRGVLTGTDGSTQTTVNITFKAAPGGSTGTPTTSYTGSVYDVNGPSKGAYDLISDVGVSASASNATKDLKDITAVGTVFDGSLTSGNGATFVAAPSSFVFTGATVESITAAFNAGSAVTSIPAPSVGDVWLVKTSRSGTTTYIALKFTVVHAESASSTANDGYVTFTYLK